MHRAWLLALALALAGAMAADAPALATGTAQALISYKVLKESDKGQMVLVKKGSKMADVVQLASKLIHDSAGKPSYKLKVFDLRSAVEAFERQDPSATYQDRERMGRDYDAHLLLFYTRNAAGAEEMRVLRRSTGEMQIRALP
jgi:hypothetical protein